MKLANGFGKDDAENERALRPETSLLPLELVVLCWAIIARGIVCPSMNVVDVLGDHASSLLARRVVNTAKVRAPRHDVRGLAGMECTFLKSVVAAHHRRFPMSVHSRRRRPVLVLGTYNTTIYRHSSLWYNVLTSWKLVLGLSAKDPGSRGVSLWRG